MDSDTDWRFVVAVVRPALILAPASFVDDIRRNLIAEALRVAVMQRDTPAIFDWLVRLISFQGISDTIAAGYDAQHGGVTFREVDVALGRGPTCPRLRSYWHFEGCGYRKGADTCGERRHLSA